MHYTVSDSILDIVQNSVEAGSGLIVLDYIERTEEGRRMLTVCVADNGKGMSEDRLKSALDPFYTDGTKHAGRRVGLGLPFLKQSCEAASGRFDIKSVEGEGTSVFFELDLGNIDAPPAGDCRPLFTECMLFWGDYEMVVNRSLEGRRYTLVRSELREAAGDLADAQAITLVKRYIQGEEEEILIAKS